MNPLSRTHLPLVLLLSGLTLGCGGEAEPEPEPRKPDDAAAVKTLEERGAILRKDGEGSVIEVNLAGGENVDDALVAEAAKLPYLQRLDLTNAKITDAALESLTGLDGLRVLNLWNTKISDKGLETLAGIKSLTNLRIRKCDGDGTEANRGVTDEGLAHLVDLPRLAELDIRYTNITDAGMVHLGKITTLKDLKLQGNQVTSAGLAEIADLEHMQRLDLWGESKFDDDIFEHIGEFDLVQLEIDQTRISLDGLENLSKFPNLQILSAYDLPVNDEVMKIIGGMTKLRSLNLRATVVGDAGVAEIAKLTELEKLVLKECSVNDEGVAHLAACTKLKNLDLSDTNVGDEGLAVLAELPELVELNIGTETFRQVSDEGVAALAKLPKLEQIFLDRLFITEDAVNPFKEVKTLKKLSLKNCGLDSAYIEELREAMPGVEIVE